MTDESPENDPARDLLVQYVLGELGHEEARSFERRLAGDADLAREVRQLKSALGLLPYSALTEPPRELRDKVLRAGERQALKRAARRPRRIVWSRFAAAAAAVLALAIGLHDLRTQRELALQKDIMATLGEPNIVRTFALTGRGGAIGRVALDLDAKKGAVVLKGLPTLPSGKLYRLWARVGQANVPCGQFGVDPKGAVLAQFVVPVESYTAPIAKLFVTVEPSTLPAEPTGPVVMDSI